MRPRRVVAGVALIVVLASVVVPGVAGSHPSSREQQIADEAFEAVTVSPDRETSTAILPDPLRRSAGPLDLDGLLSEPQATITPPTRPVGVEPTAPVIVVGAWHYDHELSWYGPGFYGQHTACGQTLTTTLLGVAHRTLPCGTLVTFKWNGRTVTVPVVDRGPYVSGRQWDLTYATCLALNHCWTGPIYWRYG
jgi:hypothetical protein